LQSLFVNDFPVRKQTLLLPIIALMVYRVYLNKNEALKWLHSTDSIRNRSLMYVISVSLFSLAHIYIASNVSGWHDSPIDTTRSHVIMVTSAINTTLVICLVVSWYRSKVAYSKIISILLFIAMMAPEVYLDFRYVYGEPTFKRRDSMIELGALIDGKQVVGCESIAMRLYNDAITYLNPYRYLPSDTDIANMHDGEYGDTVRRLVEEGRIDYAFCRQNESRFDMERMGLELIRVYDINSDGNRAMGLYKPN
jgi:hypothetical protein